MIIFEGWGKTCTLQWDAPSTRTDSTAVSVSDIIGYRLYYGTSATDLPKHIDIQNGSTMQYDITLPTGSYYFQISAIDTNGSEGQKSTTIKKSI